MKIAATYKTFFSSVLLFNLLLFQNTVSAQCRLESLQTEHLVNPLGTDVSHPRLSWKFGNCTQSIKQTAYQLYVGTDSGAVAKQNTTGWNSGKITSDKMLVTYNGGKLQPFTKYYWLVKTWDEKSGEAHSAVASFETGFMEKANWQGTWITDTTSISYKAAGYFRKAFQTGKKIKTARAYIAAAGLYELYVNGEKVGNHRLDPMYTRFDRRTLYVTYDVSKALKNGENVIGVILGNGWYNHQSTAVWLFDKASWRARPRFSMDLRITYEDGSVETIASGSDWKRSTGSLVFNSIYTAEHQDARLEKLNWNKPGYDDSAWKNAIYSTAPSQNIVSQQMQPVKDVEVLPVVKMNKVNDTVYVFDFGRNISGVSSISLNAAAGTTIRLKHAERLKKDGRVDLSNIDYHYRPTDDKDPFQTDIYITSGKGMDTFKPKFNYKGFQYVEVISDKPVQLNKQSMKAYFMHSDVAPKGTIKSSSPLINKIWAATNNSYLSNLVGYPTDCPQREKNGWTGDAHIAVETGLYNFDGITVYEKWMADHRDEQQPNGVLPSIIPTSGWGYDWGNGPDWTSTIAIIPWNVYLFYGDTQILEANYENMKRYVDHLDQISPAGLTEWGLGDWIPIKSVASKQLTSSIYFYADANILAQSARVLHKEDDYIKYQALAQKVKEAINAKFLNKEKGIYATGLQTELSAALFWGLVPEALKEKVAKNLADKVVEDGQMDVGLLGSKTILNALSENGYADIAYRLAARDTYPSWGWWIKNGASTLYENWKIEGSSDISLNHIMFGEISAWFYKALGGIFPDPAHSGFKNILLKPNFIAGLNSFEATHQSPYGEIISSWKREGKSILYKVQVPPNSTATLSLKGTMVKLKSFKGIKPVIEGQSAFSIQLMAGSYEFSVYP